MSRNKGQSSDLAYELLFYGRISSQLSVPVRLQTASKVASCKRPLGEDLLRPVGLNRAQERHEATELFTLNYGPAWILALLAHDRMTFTLL